MKSELSEILGFQIDDLEVAFHQLEIKGSFDNIKLHKIIILLCKKIEKLESTSLSPADAPKTAPKLDKVAVYNPDTEDFKCTMRSEKDNKPMEPFIVPARDIAYFEPKVAEHIKQQLANYLVGKRNPKEDAEIAKKKLLEEISVKP